MLAVTPVLTAVAAERRPSDPLHATAQTDLGLAVPLVTGRSVPAYVSGGTLAERVVSPLKPMSLAAAESSPLRGDDPPRTRAPKSALTGDQLAPTIAGSWQAAAMANFGPAPAATADPAPATLLAKPTRGAPAALVGVAAPAAAAPLPSLLLARPNEPASAAVAPLRYSVAKVREGVDSPGPGPASADGFQMISPSLATRSFAR